VSRNWSFSLSLSGPLTILPEWAVLGFKKFEWGFNRQNNYLRCLEMARTLFVFSKFPNMGAKKFPLVLMKDVDKHRSEENVQYKFMHAEPQPEEGKKC
jgi:hypothetical protein